MSLGSEYMSEHAFETDFPFGMPSDEWRKKDGTTVKLSDMTVSHIRNCMRIVGEDDPWYGQFENELKRRSGLDSSRNKGMRPCEVGGRPGLWHGFFQGSWTRGSTVSASGHYAGQESMPVAVVETEDGRVEVVDARMVRFTDVPVR